MSVVAVRPASVLPWRHVDASAVSRDSCQPAAGLSLIALNAV